MIKKLWLKLVLLYTGITGLILALCLGITFFFPATDMKPHWTLRFVTR